VYANSRTASRQVDQRRVRKAHVDPAGERGDGRIGALDQAVVPDGLDLFEVVRIGHRAAGEIPDWAAGALAGLDGPNDRGGQFHAIRNPSSPWKRAPQLTG
jgi:hypothetical protein